MYVIYPIIKAINFPQIFKFYLAWSFLHCPLFTQHTTMDRLHFLSTWCSPATDDIFHLTSNHLKTAGHQLFHLHVPRSLLPPCFTGANTNLTTLVTHRSVSLPLICLLLSELKCLAQLLTPVKSDLYTKLHKLKQKFPSTSSITYQPLHSVFHSGPITTVLHTGLRPT